MKKHFLLSCALGWAMMAGADTIDITSVRYAGPYVVHPPIMVDSVDVNSKHFLPENLLNLPLSMEEVKQARKISGDVLPGCEAAHALHLISFTLENTHYATATLHIAGLKNYQLYVDGKKQSGTELTLEPATHPVVIKYLSETGKADSLKIRLTTQAEGQIQLREDGKRMYTLEDVLHGTRLADASLSPDGKYLMTSYRTTRAGGTTSGMTRITEVSSGKVLAERKEHLRWMPRDRKSVV